MLKQRVITIAVAAPLFVAIVLFPPAPIFKLAAAAVIAAGAYEWARLSALSGWASRTGFALAVVSLCFLLENRATEWSLQPLVYWMSLVWWMFVVVWLVRCQRVGIGKRPPTILMLGMGVITLIPVWLVLVMLRALPDNGPELAMFVLLLTWVADIGAYITGRLVGRIKLAARISPGKTLEGVGGGLLAVVALAIAANPYFDFAGEKAWLCIGVSIAAAILSVAGDLYVSMLKRIANVKDSGNLVPGHGGVLDRIDSLTASAPVFMFGYIYWLA